MIRKRLVDLVFAVIAIVAGGALLFAYRQHASNAANAAAQNQAEAAADYAEGGGEYQDAELSLIESLFGAGSSTSTGSVTAGVSGNANTDGGSSSTASTASSGTASTASAQPITGPVIVELPISSSLIGSAGGNL